jgi:hypothetical protein
LGVFLLSLGSWFGTETGYMSGWGAYYLGMNFPLRFVLFGGALIGLSLLFKRYAHFRDFAHSTYVMGLLYLFIALWILSIFGNYGDLIVGIALNNMSCCIGVFYSRLLPSSRLSMV